jgi:hypothetical protein
MYDVFFICFGESNQEKNWQRVLELHPTAKKISDIKGISEAHLLCNQLCTTERFWTIDGDNWLLNPLELTEKRSEDLIFFNAIDPIDGTLSTVGGVKLWRKNSFINEDMTKGDFCKYATKNFSVIEQPFSIHKYDNTPEEAWRHTFRHLVKNMSGIIPRDCLPLNISRVKKHKKLNPYSYRGYLDAKQYMRECKGDFEKINLVNDYDWLRSKCPKEM